jgi:hypothetical protein
MSPARQDELSKLLEQVMALAPIRELGPDLRLRRIHYDWLEAGEVTQRTVARLSEQLRRYLDDQAWLENRRIMELIRQVEQNKADLRAAVVEQADATIVTDALFEQVYVDQARLTGNLRRALQTRSQASLAAVIAAHPIEQGLAELATYLKLATQDVAAMIDDERTESITWTGSDGRQRQAILPMVIFTLRDTNHEE